MSPKKLFDDMDKFIEATIFIFICIQSINPKISQYLNRQPDFQLYGNKKPDRKVSDAAANFPFAESTDFKNYEGTSGAYTYYKNEAISQDIRYANSINELVGLYSLIMPSQILKTLSLPKIIKRCLSMPNENKLGESFQVVFLSRN